MAPCGPCALPPTESRSAGHAPGLGERGGSARDWVPGSSPASIPAHLLRARRPPGLCSSLGCQQRPLPAPLPGTWLGARHSRPAAACRVCFQCLLSCSWVCSREDSRMNLCSQFNSDAWAKVAASGVLLHTVVFREGVSVMGTRAAGRRGLNSVPPGLTQECLCGRGDGCKQSCSFILRV